MSDDYLRGSQGSIIKGCLTCGQESFRDPDPLATDTPESELCLTEGCEGVRSPILLADLETVWYPRWEELGVQPREGSGYAKWLASASRNVSLEGEKR